ncbi:MAG: ATP-binding protein [Flavobacteriales bacterium]|nr:ATP-binding protein [Flavobacteriales bacterium]
MRIAIIGPESSGKSTLAKEVARLLGGALVPEAARDYLTALGRPYEQADLLAIARLQLAAEETAARASDQVICDTDILTICIWSQERYGEVDEELLAMMRRTRYDRTLLCAPDMPWEPDPLRENPHDRDRLFEVYRQWLQVEQRPNTVLAGSLQARVHHVLRALGGDSSGRP